MGRKSKFNEATKVVGFRIPISKEEQLRDFVNNNFDKVNGKGNIVNNFKTGFRDMYEFYKDIISNIHVIIPTKQGKDLWNELWNKHSENFQLISELGREVTNT